MRATSAYPKARIVIVATLLGILAWRRWAGKLHGAVWYPTRTRVVREMLDAAQIRPGDHLYDLGAGDGRIAIEAALRYGACAVGIELDPIRCAWARSRARRADVDQGVRIVRDDFYGYDLAGADIVTCYLSQPANDRLQGKLARELASGARVISNTYTFSGPRFEAMNPSAPGPIHSYKMVGARQAE